jgi:hypothetical protein
MDNLIELCGKYLDGHTELRPGLVQWIAKASEEDLHDLAAYIIQGWRTIQE